jgi:predicted nucleic acid-binding protein
MICLDTNYLIMGLVSNSEEAGQLLGWAERGDKLCVSSIVWCEFLCGPITSQHQAAMRLLIHEVVPFDNMLATEAARLFNAVGRSRLLRVDAMIAATATARNIPLATRNVGDFHRFVPFGLNLLP